jgi:hypothetical protein
MTPAPEATRTTSKPTPGAMVSAGWIAMLVGAGTFTLCYFRYFIFPAEPLVIWGDASWYFANAMRIIAGELPFRDYFTFVSPGTDLTYAALLKLFGVRMWVPALTMCFLAGLTAVLITLIAAHFVDGYLRVLPGIIFAGFALPLGPSATHHWWSSAAMLFAVIVLLGGDTVRRAAIAGVLCGVAGCYTQSKGGLCLLALIAWFIWRQRCGMDSVAQCKRKCLWCGAAAAGIFFGFHAYFIWIAGIRYWAFCMIEFPIRYYGTVPLNNWQAFSASFRWPGLFVLPVTTFLHMVPLIPLVFLVSFVLRFPPDAREDRRQKLLLVALAGCSMTLAVAPSPSLTRLSTIAAPAAVLMACWLKGRSRIKHVFRTAIMIIALTSAVRAAMTTQLIPHRFLDLPAGRAAFLYNGRYEQFLWVASHTHPGQFFFGHPPMLFALHLHNPAPIDAFVNAEYTRPEQVAASIEAWEKHRVPMLLLQTSSLVPAGDGGTRDVLGAMRVYLQRHYRRSTILPDGNEVWERL